MCDMEIYIRYMQGNMTAEEYLKNFPDEVEWVIEREEKLKKEKLAKKLMR